MCNLKEYLTDDLKNQILEFAGSRNLTAVISDFFERNESIISEPLYRGMPFPKHLIKEGLIIEEWHESSHWSKNLDISLNFAIISKGGYINDDYYEELQEELNVEAVDFAQIVLRTNSVTGIKLYELLSEIGDTNFIHEEEITTVGKDYKVLAIEKEIIDNEEIYFLDVIEI